jgi:hypothetical protein
MVSSILKAIHEWVDDFGQYRWKEMGKFIETQQGSLAKNGDYLANP